MCIERFVHYDIARLYTFINKWLLHTHTQTLTFIAEFILSAFNPFEKRIKLALSAPRMANYAIKHSNQIHRKKNHTVIDVSMKSVIFCYCLQCTHEHIQQDLAHIAKWHQNSGSTINTQNEMLSRKYIPIELVFHFSFSVCWLVFFLRFWDFLTHILVVHCLIWLQIHLNRIHEIHVSMCLSIQHNAAVVEWMNEWIDWSISISFCLFLCQSKVACILLIKNS